MPAPQRKRRILIWIGGLILGLAVVLFALPLWFPWLLGPLAQKYGAGFQSYQRMGYSRLVLNEVTYAKGNVRFSAKRVEAFQPSAWLWQRQFDRARTNRYVEI